MRLSFYIQLAAFSAFVIPLAALAEDLALRGLIEEEGLKTKRKYGPYVGVAVGESLGQNGDVRINGSKNAISSADGGAIFSVEVGKSWKSKRWPVQGSVEFEGTFMSTNLQGTVPTALLPSDVAQYEADMNSLFFTLNGSFALDLYRYRARIGKVLAGFRPYVGAGLGGGQVWFRNASARSLSQTTGGSVGPSSTPLSIDEFTHSWNWFAGLEWTWEDRYSVFIEYRDVHFGDLDDLTGYSSDGYMAGFRFRY